MDFAVGTKLDKRALDDRIGKPGLDRQRGRGVVRLTKRAVAGGVSIQHKLARSHELLPFLTSSTTTISLRTFVQSVGLAVSRTCKRPLRRAIELSVHTPSVGDSSRLIQFSRCPSAIDKTLSALDTT